MIGEKDDEYDIEIHYKDTFKAFSKDKDGKFLKTLFVIFKKHYLLIVSQIQDAFVGARTFELNS